MGDGATTANPAKSRGGFGKLKDDNVRLAEENEKLRRALEAQAKDAETHEGYDPSIDPLSGLLGVEEVRLVGKMFALPGNIQPAPVKTMPGDVVEMLKHEGVGTWSYCPFRFVGRTQEETNNLRLMNEQHHLIALPRHYADRVAESKFGKIPKVAPITPDDFTGKDRRGQPLGRKRPASGDALVELLRWYLQRYAGSLWVDFMYHRDAMDRPDFNQKAPNPYGRAFERHTGEPDPATVKVATKDGDITPGVVQGDPRSWGEKPKGVA